MVRQRIKKRLYTKMTRTMNTFMRMDSTRVRMEEMAAAMERQVSGVHKTLNREAQREYQALENALEYGIAGKKNAEQRHRLNSERELMKYPNELSQLADRMASDSWQG